MGRPPVLNASLSSSAMPPCKPRASGSSWRLPLPRSGSAARAWNRQPVTRSALTGRIGQFSAAFSQVVAERDGLRFNNADLSYRIGELHMEVTGLRAGHEQATANGTT